MEYLTELYHYVAEKKGRTIIKRLEIAKVLLTGPKAQILADTLSHPNCAITDLIINRCRAKSEKMGLIFTALANNNSVANLTLRDTNIPRDSLMDLVDMLGANRSLQMLTLLNAGLSDASVHILASGLEQSHGLIYLDLR